MNSFFTSVLLLLVVESFHFRCHTASIDCREQRVFIFFWDKVVFLLICRREQKMCQNTNLPKTIDNYSEINPIDLFMPVLPF